MGGGMMPAPCSRRTALTDTYRRTPTDMTTTRQPAVFISHGGGPCFWMDYPPPIGARGFDGLRQYLDGLIGSLPQRPRAIVVISAHWEETVATVSTHAAPPMLFDYYGFPPHTYQLSYPAPGSPEVAAEVTSLLAEAGIAHRTDTERGFDHGVFVPFLIMEPQAQIPVVMLSLRRDLNPEAHIAIGQALAPLRDRNVLIVGSGYSYHNLRSFFDGASEHARRFDDWLTTACTADDPKVRNLALAQWDRAPSARDCHPREEHLLPLMVVAGAAGDDLGVRDFHDVIGGKATSGYAFGRSTAA
jgi:aromatic ring-opening dioxygenase catalytic subunit (LigB family)